jgi:hypothetical protein
VLERLQVVEVLRGLYQGDPRVVEVPEGGGQQVRPGDVVGVQHGDDVGVDDLQRMVQVGGLGVAAVVPPQVAGAEVGGQPGDLWPVAVVEHPGLVRGPHRHRGRDRRHQHLRRLVPGRDQHRDPQRGLLDRPRRRLGPQVPEREDVEAQAERRVHFQEVQRQRHPPHRQVDGGDRPPGQVRRGDRQREDRHGPRDAVVEPAAGGGAVGKRRQPERLAAAPANVPAPAHHPSPWSRRPARVG